MSHSNERRGRVLWVTEEPPTRMLGGGNIRQSHLFRALAPAIPTDLLVVGDDVEEQVRSLAGDVVELEAPSPSRSEDPVRRRLRELAIILGSRYPSAVHVARANRTSLARELRERERGYDVICVEHESLAPLLPSPRRARWIITFHHLLSAMIGEDLRLAPGARQRWFRARDLRKAERLERWALRAYDCCVVCSDRDAQRLRALASDESARDISVIPNGVDLAELRPSPIPRVPRVLMPGTLAWPPNVDGARWFCAEVWPRVRDQVPGARLELVGRAPTSEVLALGELPGVSVAGDVPSMAPWLERARVVAVPLRIGTGTRIKALEAMAAGRPVVGTSVGLEGLGIEDGVQAVVANDPGAFANGLVELLQDDGAADILARAGRGHVERDFGWERIGRKFVELVCTLLASREPGQASLRASSRLA